VGSPSKRYEDAHDVICAAMDSAVRGERGGVAASEVDGFARAVIRERGYGQYFPTGWATG